MKRREFIMLLGGAAAAWPLAARAQQGDRVRRIGVLMNAAASEAAVQSYMAAFREALRQSGWTDGQNIRIDVRYNAADAALSRIYAAQLIGLMPDVILIGGTINLAVIQQATNDLPIVFVQVSDPVEQGFVASLTKPGGNLTGFAAYEFSIGSKWLGLLKEVAPSLTRVAVMFNPDTSPESKFFMRSIEAAARSLNVQVTATPIRATDDIEPTLETFARLPNGGLMLPTDTFTRLRLQLIVDTANRHRLPSISASTGFAADGGLLYYSYNVVMIDIIRQAAGYVDRILKGTKPADLPVQLPSKFKLVINLKTAKALGVTVPPTLYARADEVIE
jgi:putative ABC transport system substrate-binding protein